MKKIDLPPGTPLHTGEPHTGPVAVTRFLYEDQSLSEGRITGEAASADPAGKGRVSRISIDGLHDIELIKRIVQPASARNGRYRGHDAAAKDRGLRRLPIRQSADVENAI